MIQDPVDPTDNGDKKVPSEPPANTEKHIENKLKNTGNPILLLLMVLLIAIPLRRHK